MLDDVNETRDIGQRELVLNTELSSPVHLSSTTENCAKDEHFIDDL